MSDSSTHPVRDAALAVALLTIVPTGVRWPDDQRTDVAGWLPLVGLLLGAVSYFLAFGAHALGLAEAQPLVVAALLLLFLAVSTRFLHHDGLADVSDAWWGGHTHERRLEIMKDSATGAFGVAALCFASLAGVTAVGGLLAANELWPLFAAPPIARCAATFAAWLGAPARSGGLGRSIMGAPKWSALLPFVAVLGGVIYAMWSVAGLIPLILCVFGVALALVAPHLVSMRMGGVTGDVMGASVLVVETSFYVVASLVVGL